MKSKILTLTPNPALDVNGMVDELKVDEKTYVRNEMRSPGGNAINVARILDRLKIPVLASGFFGGSTGDEIASLLKAEHVQQHFIKIKNSTRINLTISNTSDHRQTRLSFPGPRVTAAEKYQLLRFVKGCRDFQMAVIGGSLPQQYTVQDFNKLIRTAQEKRMKVVVDCPGEILRRLAVSDILMLKPNLEEFQAMTLSRVQSISAVKRKAQIYLNRASYICVSSVEEGALLVSQHGCYFGRIPPVKIRSTVGAGDSMVGAMVAQLHLGTFAADEILRWGLAAAAATLSEKGTQLGKASEIKRLYRKTVVTAV